jgi:hypothetical protein
MSVIQIDFSEKDMYRWAEPLIVDLISRQYKNYFEGTSELAEIIGQIHVLLWKNLLKTDIKNAGYTRRRLSNVAKTSKLDWSFIDLIDFAVLEILSDTIIRRGLRSSEKAKIENMIVINAALNLRSLPGPNLEQR